jgi:hypothetical protein
VRMDHESGIENQGRTEQSPTAYDGKSGPPTDSLNVLEALEKENSLPEPAEGSVPPAHESSGGGVHIMHADRRNIEKVAANAPQRVITRTEALSAERTAVSTGHLDCTEQSETLPAERADISTRPFYGTEQSRVMLSPSSVSPRPTNTSTVESDGQSSSRPDANVSERRLNPSVISPAETSPSCLDTA